jgi:hypothetical protein
MSLAFEVYTMDKPYDILNIIPRRTKVSLSNELSEVGGGTLTMQRNDPKFTETPSLMDYRNIVKCRKPNGQYVGGFLVQSTNSSHIDQDETAGETETFGGEGLLTWFRDATVEPYGGLRQDSADSRTFSFASERGAWYNADDWTPPQTSVKYLDPSPWGTAPAEWPDAPEARWIWPTANATEQGTRVGTAYFRREFALDKEYKAALFFAGDDEFEVYLDGQQVMKVETGETWQKTYRVDTTISQGLHVLAVKIRNTGGPSGLLGALRIWGDPNVPSSAYTFIYTGDTVHGGWKTMGYPDEEPGWTPGEIILALFREAKARDIQFTKILKPTFTATHDSNGEEWATKRPWEFDVGLEYLEVLQKLSELYCDVEVDVETYEFNAWNSRGKDLTVADNPIRFRRGVSVLMSASQGKAPIKNTLNIKTADGWITKQDTRNSISKYGRIEGKITTELGLGVSNDVASLAFDQVATPEEAATMQFIPAPGLVPFEDFNLGDWVIAPGKTPNEKRRIVSMSVTETDSANIKYEAEFDTLFRTKQDRLARSMDTLTAGSSMTGRLANATTDRPSGGLGTPAFNSNSDSGVPGSGGGTGGGSGTIPATPGGLAVSTVGYWSRDGAPLSKLTASWNPVTRATDGSTTSVSQYQVWGRETDDASGVKMLLGTSQGSSAVIRNLDPGVALAVSVSAVNGVGNTGGTSSEVATTTAVPTNSLGRPSNPVLSQVNGAIRVDWDGLLSNEAPPYHFDYLYASISNIATGPWESVGQNLVRKGSIVLEGVPAGDRYIRLIAVDRARQESSASVVVKITV